MIASLLPKSPTKYACISEKSFPDGREGDFAQSGKTQKLCYIDCGSFDHAQKKKPLTLLHPSTTIFTSTRGFSGLCLDDPPPARTLAMAPSKSVPFEAPLAVRLSVPLPVLPPSPKLLVDPPFSPVPRALAALLLPNSLLSGGEEAGLPSRFGSCAT